MSSVISKTGSSSKKKMKKVSQQQLRKLAQEMQRKRQNDSNLSSTSHHHITKDIRKLKTNFDREELEVKRRKLVELKRQAETKKAVKVKPAQPKGILKKVSLVSGYSDNSSSDEESNDEEPSNKKIRISTSSSTNQSTAKSSNNKSSTPTSANGGTSVLPEGFFDDPDVDAKIHGKDTKEEEMKKEWELFQKELQHENVESEQIIEDDHQIENLDRQIMEIDEQIQFYNNFNQILCRKDEIAGKNKNDNMDVDKVETSEDDDSDNDDYNDDWRTKNPFS